MMHEMIKTRENYISVIRRELLGPGSEISIPDEKHELISSSPDGRYSLGVLFPPDCKMNADNDDTVRAEESEEEDNSPEEDLQEDNSSERDEHEVADVTPDEEDNLDEQVSLSAQNMPSSAGITFLGRGDTDKVSCHINFGTYRRTLPKDCIVPFEVKMPERVQVPTGLNLHVKYDIENQCFRLLDSELTKKMITAAQHSAEERDEERDPFPAMYQLYEQLVHGYVRVPHSLDIVLDFTNGDYFESGDEGIDGIPVKINGLRRKYHDDVWSVTVMLVNNAKASARKHYKIDGYDIHQAIFQPEIKISTDENDFLFEPFSANDSVNSDSGEELTLEMQYRNKRNYANGLGAAANWDIDADGKGHIWTDFYPVREMPGMEFSIPKEADINSNALKMLHLSDLDPSSKESKIHELNTILQAYESWIVKKKKQAENLDDRFTEVKGTVLNNCETALRRMREGLQSLQTNNNAWIAFQLANRAMYMQRVHLKLQSKTSNIERFPDDEELSKLLDTIEEDGYETANQIVSDKYEWRLFQIAFLIMSINSIINDSHDDRRIVDLIWFPTGGGKTEAYLGLTAFSIFYRRLQHPDSCGGTTVMMRYTLRLLTAQQFTRASTLICACEYIRSDSTSRKPRYHKYPLGDECISIGLWIGGNHTPNRNEEAKALLKKLNDAKAGNLRNVKEQNNKFQVLKCPWCGTKLVKEIKDGKLVGQWGYVMENNSHFRLRCPQESCFFSSEDSLPIQVIDEELYNNPPSLLFGTVDKFAMLPWRPAIGSFFGIGSKNRAPELIIQDELHLISGPLGTMVGLYETAIDDLCNSKGIPTKIIASTATIRRAREQCMALYDRKVSQFPPPGIDAEDSFFSREAKIDHEKDKFGRIYIGLMGAGKTKAMMEVRVISALMQHIHQMKIDDEIKDKYWTLTGYFNSLKELGKCTTLVEDDVKDAIRRIAMRLGNRSDARRVLSADELTSRVSTTQLNETLDKLEKLNYSKENIENRRYASNIVLATNMISVGIDVARLNVMLMVGQPKLTSEYIQASSRVGREFPGIVFTLYDGVRSRDRSHYEQFRSYHDAFYKYVEPTGATPFSGPARDRALHAIVIGLLRNLEADLQEEKSVSEFDDSKYQSRINLIKKSILERNAHIVSEISPDAENDNEIISAEIDTIIEKWKRFAESGNENMYYGERFLVKAPQNGEKRLLKVFSAHTFDDEHPFETMTSMRSVDGTVQGNVRIWED